MGFNVLFDVSERNQLWSSILIFGVNRLTGLLLNRPYVFANLLILNLGCGDNKITEQTILGSSLKGLIGIRLGLNNVHTLIDATQHNTLEGSNLEVFIVVNFVKNVKGYDSLGFG